MVEQEFGVAGPEAREAESFDFAGHRRAAIDAYVKVRPSYESFATAIRDILRSSIKDKVHSVEGRAKGLDSFGDKAATPSEEDTNRPKYRKPLEQITDLAGVRVITYFLNRPGNVGGSNP